MVSMIRERVGSAHLIALLALFVALGGSAYAGGLIGTSKIKNNAVTTAKIKNASVTAAKMKEYFNSGVVKLDDGEDKVMLERGPFTFLADCEDIGFDESVAHLWVRNTGASNALLQSQYNNGDGSSPTLAPGELLEAFSTVSGPDPLWLGGYRNMFSVTSSDGSTSLVGGGTIGVKVLGSDCAFQLFAWGS